MILVRVSAWRKTSEELSWMVEWFVAIRGIGARIRKSGGKFAVFREMDLEMAERLGWVGDTSYYKTRRARADQVASGGWR